MNQLLLVMTALIGSLATAVIIASLGYRLQSRFAKDAAITTTLQVKDLLLKQAFTRDMVPVDANFTLCYRIQAAGNPKPISRAILEGLGTVDDWRTATERQVLFTLRDVIATYDFDHLFDSIGENVVPLRSIEQKVHIRLRPVVEQWGVEVTGVQLGAIEIPESIKEQLVEKKRAQYEQKVELMKAETEKLVKLTEAKARMETITAIAQGIKHLLGKDARPQDLIALRFIEYLEKAAETGGGEESWLPLQRLDALRALEELGFRHDVEET